MDGTNRYEPSAYDRLWVVYCCFPNVSGDHQQVLCVNSAADVDWLVDKYLGCEVGKYLIFMVLIMGILQGIHNSWLVYSGKSD